MYRKWVANTDRSQARKLRDTMELNSGSVCLIGRPSADGPWSVAEMEVMNLVGIYMEVPDSKPKPDPNCPECHGAGVIVLFTSSTPCKCLSRHSDEDKGYDDPDYSSYWE